MKRKLISALLALCLLLTLSVLPSQAGPAKRKLLRGCLKVVRIGTLLTFGAMIGCKFAEHAIEQSIWQDYVDEIQKRAADEQREQIKVEPLKGDHGKKPEPRDGYGEMEIEVYDT